MSKHNVPGQPFDVAKVFGEITGPGGQAEASVKSLEESLEKAKARGDQASVKFFTVALADAKDLQDDLKALFGPRGIL